MDGWEVFSLVCAVINVTAVIMLTVAPWKRNAVAAPLLLLANAFFFGVNIDASNIFGW